MVDVSSLVIKVDSRDVKVSAKELEKFARSGGKAEKQTTKLARSSDKLKSNFIGLRGAAASLGGALAFRQVVRAADTFQLLNARIALVTDTSKEAEQVYGDLLEMSQRTRSELESTITLYTRLARSTEALNLSSDELLTVTEAISQSFKVSGANSAEAAAAAIQLSQGLAAGALRGDEFNSVAEQAPRLMKALADETRHTSAELKKMAADGKITAEIVSRALINQSKVIQSEFEQIPVTVGDAMTQLANDTTDAFGRADVSPLVDAIGELRGIVTDDGFQTSMVSLASAIASIASGLATATNEGVKFSRWLGEELARSIHGVGAHDMVGLQQQASDLVGEISRIEESFVFFSDMSKGDIARLTRMKAVAKRNRGRDKVAQ